VKEQVLDRPEQEQHRQDQARGEDRRHVKAEADGHPDGGHHPDRCCCREAVDLVALAQDGAGAEESNACDNLGGDSRRIRGALEGLETQSREQAGADADESKGFDSGGMAVELALETDGDREYRCDKEPESEIYVAEERQLLSLYPAVRRVGPCCEARRGTRAGRAGRGCSRSL
jgi:hypothetical protein